MKQDQKTNVHRQYLIKFHKNKLNNIAGSSIIKFNIQ